MQARACKALYRGSIPLAASTDERDKRPVQAHFSVGYRRAHQSAGDPVSPPLPGRRGRELAQPRDRCRPSRRRRSTGTTGPSGGSSRWRSRSRRSRPKREMVFVSWADAVELVEAINDRCRALIYLSVDSGMRWSELVG